MIVISRAEAVELGLKRYFTGEPCPKGHVAERQVCSCGCLECGRERARERYRERSSNDPEWAGRERERMREWHRSLPPERRERRLARMRDGQRGRYLRSKYGITEADEAAQIAIQDGCALCGTTDYGANGPNVDHCHATDKVRGMLCHSCNADLLPFADNGRVHMVAPFVRFYAEHGAWGEAWPPFQARRMEAQC